MELNSQNYFSKEADLEYMSVSQFKNFMTCEAKALNDLQCNSQEKKESFLQGHFFEELVSGDSESFIKQHPEMISTRGTTAGKLKSEFLKIVKSAKKFKEQELFMDAINNSEKQVILTGTIKDVKVKCCLDLLDLKNQKIYDIKCMKDFSEQWDKQEKRYVPWYYYWGYVLQLAVYNEIAGQNYNCNFNTYLMAASKEEQPDICGIQISSYLLYAELQDFETKIKRYDNIKKGLEVPTSCGCCDFCKSQKRIKEWKVIK